MPIQISSHFDSGAIDVVSLDNPSDIRLRIRGDNASAFAQWFHFRLSGARGVACSFCFENAGQCAYPEGWRGYNVVISEDGQRWTRVPAEYDGQQLRFALTPRTDALYIAYFEPYSESRHHALLSRLQQHAAVSLSEIGQTTQGRTMDLLQIGTPGADKRRIWIIARQHPGETMAEWFVEGLLNRLLEYGDHAGDPLGRKLLGHAVFYVVPNMNPDGSALGNLRTNAVGANLNREWREPSSERSPEVLCVREALDQTGCDLFLDVHGDEALPYVFVDGCDGLPSFTDQQEQEQQRFLQRFLRASPDFQTRYGYPRDHFRDEVLTIASKYIGHTYGCLSLTLELPFKDNANDPRPETGWDGARSAALGAAMVSALYWHCVPGTDA